MKNVLGDSHFIFSVENPLVSPVHGQSPSTEDVSKFLNDNGEAAEIVEGHYGKPERSILVKNPKNIAGLHQLASDAGQESAIFSQGGNHQMHFYNGPQAGAVITGQRTKLQQEKPADNYTTVHTEEGPIHFQHNFDFGKSEQLKKVKINKGKEAQPMQVRLDEGNNKGKVVNVIGEDSNDLLIKPQHGDKLGMAEGESIGSNESAQWSRH